MNEFKKVEVYKTLVLSTAHLTEEWADKLQSNVMVKTEEGILVYQNVEYGYRLFITEDMPEFFFPAATLAQAHGCRWLEYDQDAEEVEGLETYEW
jgi:hypothetical protein